MGPKKGKEERGRPKLWNGGYNSGDKRSAGGPSFIEKV